MPPPAATTAAPTAATPELFDPRRTALVDTAPLAISVLLFGLVIGATIAESEVSAPGALAGSVLVLAGAAQLAAIGMVDAGAGIAVAVSTALLINVRFVLYSAGFAQWFADEPRWRRLLLVIPLVDQTFLLGQQRFDATTSTHWRRRFFLTASGLLMLAFVAGQAVGLSMGRSLGDGSGLHLAAPLAFGGMLVLACRSRADAISAVVASVVAVAATAAPGHLALPLAIVAGVGVATLTESQLR